MSKNNSFNTKDKLTIGYQQFYLHNLAKLPDQNLLAKLPFVHRVLLENLLRCEDAISITKEDITALLNRAPQEILFTPARVLLQDFTGVPVVVDLAAMRDAMRNLHGDVKKINPLQPVELVVDHSVQVDYFRGTDAFEHNSSLEYARNEERYEFLKWGQGALENFKVVPPETGIVHQVNLEYLARVVFERNTDGEAWLLPDTVVGTDSHTPMINGLGVLGWGVGGIEAEAAMLGQPISMLIPRVVGVRLVGELAEGVTATDLVLTVTNILRAHGVVDKFVEFFGAGLSNLTIADRATIANMAPEYGATCGFFPIDEETINYLKFTGRSAEHCELVKTYAQQVKLWHDAANSAAIEYDELLELDLSSVEPCMAGPKRPQDQIKLKDAKAVFFKNLTADCAGKKVSTQGEIKDRVNAIIPDPISHGAIVIAAITSCTNTSNPAVMLAAGLVARKALAKGLQVPAWVKTSLAPGSRVVTSYLKSANLLTDLEQLGFNLVGYGCTTCIGNSGPLPEEIANQIIENDLHVCSVLSGNRNFEGRIHPLVRMNYLASPPLVVAYALAGRMDIDLYNEPLGIGKDGQAVYLKDIWPTQQEIAALIRHDVQAEMFTRNYSQVFQGGERWERLTVEKSELYQWRADSTYIKNPPYFDGMTLQIPEIRAIADARILVMLGDSVTTDHISPAGAIAQESPAGKYLIEHGVLPRDFNSYGSRRGNHEIMMRGTFANVRLKNKLAPGTEGCWTRYQPSDEEMSIYDAAMRYKDAQVQLGILAGKEYGSGSSRDWAAKGPSLLGVKFVIAESYERIHRSNLIGMGILPLEFIDANISSLKLSGRESYSISGLIESNFQQVTVTAKAEDGQSISFKAKVRLNTPREIEYYRHGGILPYVLRQLAHK